MLYIIYEIEKLYTLEALDIWRFWGCKWCLRL